MKTKRNRTVARPSFADKLRKGKQRGCAADNKWQELLAFGWRAEDRVTLPPAQTRNASMNTVPATRRRAGGRVIIACFLLFAGNCKLSAAGFDSSSVGTHSAQFLKIAVGAKATAMGEAYTAMTDDAGAIYWNTAGLIKIKKQSIVMTHIQYLADMSYDYMAYAQNTGSVGAWGFSIQYLNAGSIKKTNSSGIDTGSFSPYDLAVSVGFACYVTGYNKDPEQRFVLGANGKFIQSKITGSDSTVSADVGVNFPYLFDDRFRMAMVIQNMMGTLRFDKYEYPLPLIFRFGTATEISKHFIITADITAPKDNYAYLSMGAELNINMAKTATVSLRSGFNTRALFDFEGLRNIMLGAGATYKEYSLDYSFSPYGELGNVHRISAGFKF